MCLFNVIPTVVFVMRALGVILLCLSVQVIGDTVSESPVKPLTVSAVSKIVRLPENEATLSAYTVPAEQPG